jgi:hypothetical protein
MFGRDSMSEVHSDELRDGATCSVVIHDNYFVLAAII